MIEWKMVETAKSESEMSETSSKYPQTMDQLSEYIDSLVNNEHNYGTCVYAMSLAAVAAFHFVAQKLNTTGFQQRTAARDLMKRTGAVSGPFLILHAENAIYPDFDFVKIVKQTLLQWRPWLRERAKYKLANTNLHLASRSVVAHWKRLAKS
jgi:hypothetical protein